MTEVKKQSQAKQSQPGVGLITKTFQILDLFQIDAPTWSQSELIRETGMNRSTASRLVRYLVDTGYLVLHATTGRYGLGVAAIDLGRRAKASFDLKEVCQPALERVSKITDETIILTALDRANNSAVCVDQIEGQRGGLRVFEKIGATFPLHAGAAPKAILALLPEEIQNRYIAGNLAQITEHTLTREQDLKTDFDKIKANGYSVSLEETYEGVAGIAAAFLGPDGYPVGSIAIALPVQRINDEKTIALGREIAKIAKEVSLSLCGAPLIDNSMTEEG